MPSAVIVAADTAATSRSALTEVGNSPKPAKRTPPVGQKSVFMAPKRPRPVTRVSRQNSDLSVINDGLVCSKCHSAIPYTSTYVKLKPCGCSVCLECLINSHAARGSCLLRCCEMPVVSHRFIDAERVPRKEEVLASTEGDSEKGVDLALERPYEHMMRTELPSFQRIEGDKIVMVLHCSYLCEKLPTFMVKTLH